MFKKNWNWRNNSLFCDIFIIGSISIGGGGRAPWGLSWLRLWFKLSKIFLLKLKLTLLWSKLDYLLILNIYNCICFRIFLWSDMERRIFSKFLFSELSACSNPRSRDNHCKARHPRTKQRDQLQVEPRSCDQGRCKKKLLHPSRFAADIMMDNR